jgi:hypothetical protein
MYVCAVQWRCISRRSPRAYVIHLTVQSERKNIALAEQGKKRGIMMGKFTDEFIQTS